MPKQKDGRYRAKITVGYDADDKPIAKYVSGRTARELEANKAALRQRYIDGTENARFDILFNVYAAEWYEVHKKPHIGGSSRASYWSLLNKHIFPEFEGRQIRAIRAVDLQRFLNDRKHMSRTTTDYLHGIFKAVFSRAVAEGIIARDPTTALQKAHAPEAHRRALTDAETNAALDVMENHTEGLLLSLLYYTGARRGEALGLRWSDIDFAGRWIRIERDIDFVINGVGNVKSTASNRRVPMPDELYNLLNRARGIGDAYLLPAPESTSPMCQSTFIRRWNRLMSALSIADRELNKDLPPAKFKPIEQTDGRSILTPHYFRHNYATVLYNASVDVLTAQRYLGHSDPKTTLSIYTHLSKQKEEGGAALVNDAFSKKVARKLPEKKKHSRDEK